MKILGNSCLKMYKVCPKLIALHQISNSNLIPHIICKQNLFQLSAYTRFVSGNLQQTGEASPAFYVQLMWSIKPPTYSREKQVYSKIAREKP